MKESATDMELMHYLYILWKRKWLIIVGVIASMILAGGASFLLKPVYEIDAIIQPGKFFVENEAGNFVQVVIEEPQQIADKVNLKSYDALIASKLKLDISEIPELRAESIKDTLLTRIWIRSKDVELSKSILKTLVSLIQEGINEKIEIEIDNIEADIDTNEIDKKSKIEQVEILKNKIKIIEQRKRDIVNEMASVKNKISELEKEQLKVLKRENRGEIESLGMLLYSNEIQESIRYYGSLNEKLSYERIREEDVNSDLQDERASIDKLDTTIANLKERKGRIDLTKIIKEPTRSLYPVFPRKKAIVLIAGIFSLIIFTTFAFFLEYIKKYKATS